MRSVFFVGIHLVQLSYAMDMLSFFFNSLLVHVQPQVKKIPREAF